MNGLFLFLLWWAEGKEKITIKRREVLKIVLSAFIGGMLSCFVMITFQEISFIPRFFIIHGILGYLMIWTAFDYKSVRQRLKALIKLNLIEIIISGILNMVMSEENFLEAKNTGIQAVENKSIYKTVGIGVFAAVVLGRIFCSYQRERYTRSHLYPLKLYYNGKSCEGVGLLDTGNHLRDPVSQRPVIIASLKAVRSLFGEELLAFIANLGKMQEEETPYMIKWIPYHSLGKKNGFMPGIIIDGMTVYQEGKELISKKVLIGIIEEELSEEGLYQFILHEEYMEL